MWICAFNLLGAAANQCPKKKVTESLSQIFQKTPSQIFPDPPSTTAIWALDKNGRTWYANPATWGTQTGNTHLQGLWMEIKPYLRHESWGFACGRFVQISAGGGVVWGRGDDHRLFAYSNNIEQSEFEPPDNSSGISVGLYTGQLRSNSAPVPGSNPDVSIRSNSRPLRNKSIHTSSNTGKNKFHLSNSWIEVSDYLENNDTTRAIFVDISVGSNVVWAVTKTGHVVVREGVTPTCPQGTLWRPLLDRAEISRVHATAGGVVWGIKLHSALLVYRDGYAPSFPHGSRWMLGNGLIDDACNLGDGVKDTTRPPPYLPRYKVFCKYMYTYVVYSYMFILINKACKYF